MDNLAQTCEFILELGGAFGSAVLKGLIWGLVIAMGIGMLICGCH
jgi:hypothetical protein